MERVDRGTLLTRAGRLALAAGTIPWRRLLASSDAVDPRVRTRPEHPTVTGSLSYGSSS